MRRWIPVLALTIVGCGQLSAPATLSTSDIDATKAWARDVVARIEAAHDNAKLEKLEIDRANETMKSGLVGKKVTWRFRVVEIGAGKAVLESEFGHKDKDGNLDATWMEVRFDGERTAHIGTFVAESAAVKLRKGDSVTISRKVKSASVHLPQWNNAAVYVAVDLE